MGIFDHHTSNANATYDLDDGTHVEIGPDPAPMRPEPGEYRLLTTDSLDLAVGTWQRAREEYTMGDKYLYNLYHEWEEYEQYPDEAEKPNQEKPTRIEKTGYSQGDYAFIYFPAETQDTDEQKEYSAQLLANYIWSDIYLVEVTDPDGNTKLSESIDDYDTQDSPLTFEIAYGTASNDDVERMLDQLAFDEN